MATTLSTLAYLVASVLFILALRGLSHPETSRQGNLFGMVGMAIAIAATLLKPGMGAGGIALGVTGLAIGGTEAAPQASGARNMGSAGQASETQG